MKATLMVVTACFATAALAGDHWYADPTAPNNDWDGSEPTNIVGTLKGPKRTLQAAVAKAATGDTVHAAPGVYDEGEVWADGNSNRVYIANANVAVVATGGRDVTAIEGRLSDSAGKSGEDAIRAVRIKGAGSYIKGFTIRNGSTVTGTSPTTTTGGGGVCGGTAVDCVITNCASGYRGAVYSSRLISCLVYPHCGGSYATLDCSAYNCVFREAQEYGNQPIVNCSFFETGPQGKSIDAPVYNSYIEAPKKNVHLYRCYHVRDFNASGSTREDDCRQITYTEAKLDPETLRPLTGSVLIDVGSDGHYERQYSTDFMTLFGQYDFAMMPRHRGASIDVGALEGDWAEDFADILSNGNAYFSVPKVSPAAYTNDLTSVALPAGSELTGSWANPSGAARPAEVTFAATVSDGAVLKVYLNGATEPVWTISAADGAKTVAYLSKTADVLRFVCEGEDGTAVLSAFTSTTHSCVYADAVNGNDAWDGSVDFAYADPDAKRGPTLSLQKAVDLAEPGEKVYAATGVYDKVETWNNNCSNRLWISKANIGVIAIGAQADTVIAGAADSAAARGCGSASVRCVCISADTGSYIRGFTLRNGHTGTGSSCLGSCLDGGLAIECRMCESPVGYRGVVNNATVIRCLIDELTTDSAYGLYKAEAYDCVVKAASGLSVGPFVNCTFLNGSAQGVTSSAVAKYYNCYVSGSRKWTSYFNSYSSGSWNDDHCTHDDDCKIINATAANLDPETCRPQKGSSLIDVGKNAYYEDGASVPDAIRPFLTEDWAGGQRIYNGSIDIGAGEYDWRGDFSVRMKHLKRYDLVVASASPAVTTNALGGVTLTDGTALTADWTTALEGEISFSTMRTGAGTLTVTCDGAPVSVDPETGRGAVSVVAGAHRIEFSFSGTGTVALSDFREPGYGFMILLR